MSTTGRGLLLLITAALLYSIMPVLIRSLGAGHLPPVSQVFLRYLVAFLAAALYFRSTKEKLALPESVWPTLILVTVFGYGLTNLFFTYGTLLTEIGSVLFLFYCFAILAPLMAYFFLGEKIRRINLFSLLMILLALFLLFQPNSKATWKLGGVFALLAALGQTFYIVGRKKLTDVSSAALLLLSTFAGVVVIGALALILENRFYFGAGPATITALAPQTWLLTVLFGLDNFTAWFFMSQGLRLVGTATGSLTLLLENVFALVFAFIFFREIPTLVTFLGGAIILTAAGLVIINERR